MKIENDVVIPTGKAKRIIRKIVEKDPRTVLFLVGGPGVGKSAICKQVAEELKIGYKETFLLTRNPVDFAAPFPSADRKYLELLPLKSALPRLDVDGERGIWLLDEISSAPLAVQTVAQRIVWDRKLEEEKVPEGWVIIAAGNRVTDKGVVYQLPSPLAGRFTRLEIEPDLEDWIENFALPFGIANEIISCLRTYPEIFFGFDPAQYKGGAFPSPRGWEKVDRKLKNIGWQDEDFYVTVVGDVGVEAASKLMAFMRVYATLPSAEEVIEGKVKITEGDDRSKLFALVGTVVNFVVQKKDKEVVKKFLKNAVMKAPAAFATIMMKDILNAGLKSLLIDRDVIQDVYEVKKKYGMYFDL